MLVIPSLLIMMLKCAHPRKQEHETYFVNGIGKRIGTNSNDNRDTLKALGDLTTIDMKYVAEEHYFQRNQFL